MDVRVILDAARSLASDASANPEYDRALVDLTATILGLSDIAADDPDLVRELILPTREV